MAPFNGPRCRTCTVQKCPTELWLQQSVLKLNSTNLLLPSVLWRCWLGGRKGIRPAKKTEWWVAGMVICLERGADLHMAQLMPLPLTVSCLSKIQIGFTFLVQAHPGSPGKRAVKWVCLCVSMNLLSTANNLISNDILCSRKNICMWQWDFDKMQQWKLTTHPKTLMTYSEKMHSRLTWSKIQRFCRWSPWHFCPFVPVKSAL